MTYRLAKGDTSLSGLLEKVCEIIGGFVGKQN